MQEVELQIQILSGMNFVWIVYSYVQLLILLLHYLMYQLDLVRKCLGLKIWLRNLVYLHLQIGHRHECQKLKIIILQSILFVNQLG
jgi:hypothetical protein